VPVASDLAFSAAALREGVVLELGERIALLLQCRPPASPAPAGSGGLLGESAEIEAVRQAIRHAAPLAVPVSIRGETGTGKELAARSLHEQSVYFNVTGFTVGTTPDNGKAYDPNDPPRTLKLGVVEEWTVTSIQASHPFHVHVNAFQVMEKGADGKLHPGDWKDTVMVKQGDANKLVVRTRYEDFDGAFVLHCHILDHEDQGMMEGVEIVK
jgi:FtsP/CotA-like multicopper oxidase with cupredoxin domain